MKKFRIFQGNMGISPALTNFETELQAVKLSPSQAMYFKGRFPSFEEMLKRYGENRRLKLNEKYNGYIAIHRAAWKQDLVFMKGEIRQTDSGSFAVLFESEDGVKPGFFANTWMVNDAKFAFWTSILQERHMISSRIDAAYYDRRLKSKIIYAILNNTPVTLSDDECLIVLNTIPGKFHQIFKKFD